MIKMIPVKLDKKQAKSNLNLSGTGTEIRALESSRDTLDNEETDQLKGYSYSFNERVKNE